MNSRVPRWVWIPQVIAAAIMASVAVIKFRAGDNDVALFTDLGMEPTGRLLVATLEALCALLLLSPYAALGATLGMSIMMGAIIAHATVLGAVVGDDNGAHIGMLALVVICCALVGTVRRRELPFIGDTL